ncbi:cystathionine gamma-synthase [Cerasicoccus arenae]|uniref:Cystathionine gamma-synthase n=2 Tax=Cerasicoccus arenae TaxID=424488 RepID=A0A8J3DDN4_9BACT|nr:cystathionine gamma-synthase [Cerasicoccus arenae]
MDDVIGYEEKRPATIAQVKYAYPRFVLHDYVVRAMNLATERLGLAGRAVFLLPSESAAQDCVRWLNAEDSAVVPESDFFCVSLPDNPELRHRAKVYLQHTGLCISSRHAEDYLRAHGQAPPSDSAIDNNFLSKGNSASKNCVAKESKIQVLNVLQSYLPTDEIHLANCGMNAFYGALRAARQVQAPRGRTRYLQLGWLYLDTQRILEQFLGPENKLTVQFDVFDETALRQLFAEAGDELAAIVTELPTNPLIQTPNVALLDELCRKHGVIRIYDPTIAGISSVDVLPHTDLLVTSLTKYAAHQGDVMIGAAAVNPTSPFADELSAALAGKCEQPYARDLARLAAQIDTMPEIATQQSANARGLIEWLEAHPAIRKVWHPRSAKTAANFNAIARSDDACGTVFTIELNGPLTDFYDNARIVKGPSFGTGFTMMCPFMYLAHFEEVTSEAGRARLLSYDLNPELIRMSAGIEPLEKIQEALGI